MKARLQTAWEQLRTSFWFVPLLMALSAVGLANGLVALDASVSGRALAQSVGWIWSGGAGGARSLLSTVASSMITVAGTVFSITIAALTLASSQFGPRLLRNFTRDTGNQVVLGTFVSTFLFCLLVLRAVRGQNEGDFVPYLSITVGLLLAAVSIGVLIYFIHHVAVSIQAEHLVATVGRELRSRVVRLQPQEVEEDGLAAACDGPSLPDHACAAVQADASGYVQQVDRASIVSQATEDGLQIRLERQPGDFVMEGEALMWVWTRSGRLEPDRSRSLQEAVSLGDQRTPTADLRYGVQQLTEIASRALSPGINDPFTAVACTDWLMDALARVARREPLPRCHRDATGEWRLLEQPADFDELARLSIGPLRAYGARSAIVTLHLLGGLARLAGCVAPDRYRATILREAELTAEAAVRAEHVDCPKRELALALDRVRVAAAGRVGGRK